MGARFATAALLLVPTAAWSGWATPLTVSGTPADVDVADAGAPAWYAVSTSTGAYGFTDTTLLDTVVAAGTVGALFDHAHGCIAAVAATAPSACHTTWQATCPTNTGTGPSGGLLVQTCLRARQLLSTGGYLYAQSSAGNDVLYSTTAGAGAGASWIALTPLAGVALANGGGGLGVESATGADVSLSAPVITGALTFMSCSASAGFCASQAAAPLAAPVTDLEFLSGSSSALAVGTLAGNPGLALVPLDAGVPTAIALPPGVVRIGGLSFDEGTGTAFGNAFGMLSVGFADGGSGILSAVPDPANPAKTWVPSSAPPAGYGGALQHLRCRAGSACAVVTDAVGASNLVFYRNAAAPDVSQIPATFTLPGLATTPVGVDAGDLDGDAVFVTWVLDGGCPGFTVTPQAPQNLVAMVQTSAAPQCGQPAASCQVTLHVSDGVHDSQTPPVTLTVPSAGGAVQPALLPDGGLLVLSPGQTVPLAFSVDGGCPVTGFLVTPTNGTCSSVNGPNLIAISPVCMAGPCVDRYQVTSQGPGGDGGPVTLTVEVLDSPEPTPALPDGGFLTVRAGGSPVTVAWDAGTGCATSSFSATPLSTPAGTTLVMGLLTPPENWCGPGPGVDTYQVTATGAAGTSDAGLLTVDVLPWGPPLPPFAAGSRTATQDAGPSGTTLYARDETHVCDDGGVAFPGVSTLWTWVTDAGVVVVGDGGGTTMPLDSPFVSVTLPDCVASAIVFSATNLMNDNSGQTSSPSSLTVSSNPISFPPLNTSALNLQYMMMAPAAGLPVTATLSPPQPCDLARGIGLTLALEQLDGGTVEQVTAPFDAGSAQAFLAPPPACSAGSYLVAGQVFDAKGDPGPSANGPVQFPQRPVVVSRFTFAPPQVQCRAPLDGSVTAWLDQDAGSCGNASAWSWQQNGGPAVTFPGGAAGNPVAFEIADAGFDLVGQSVDLGVTAQANPGNAGQGSVSVPIGVAPFLTVSYSTSSPQPDESGLLGVAISLENATDCDVFGFDYCELPARMVPVLETARWDGAPMAVDRAYPNCSGFAFKGLALAAHGRTTLTYSARAPLLSHPTPAGQAFLNGFAISNPAGAGTPSGGCGCGSGVDPVAALSLLGLLAARRARRPTRRS